MLKKLGLILIAVTGTAIFSTSAFAEIAPSCAGGGTATGTFHCTGPLNNPVCEEGPPWKCPIKTNSSNGELSLGGSNGGHRPKGLMLQGGFGTKLFVQ